MRKEKKYHFIYKTTNLLSGRYYIGMHSTDNLNDGYLGSGKRLRYSINKYGKETHIREILEFCKTREELKSRETEIVNLNEIAKESCINLVIGGNTNDVGYWLGKKRPDYSGENHPMFGKVGFMKGKTHSKETKLKMSISAKNKPAMSDATKMKLRELNTGENNAYYGKKHNEEVRQAMKISAYNRKKQPACKTVLQYSLDNIFIKEWDDVNSASEYIGKSATGISACIHSRQKTAGGFIWRLKNKF